MRAKPHSWSQNIRQHWVAIAVFALILAVVIALILAVAWLFGTGFGGYDTTTITSTLHGTTTTKVHQPEKTLWDWMQLLIVPVVLAVGGFLFSVAQSRNQEKSVQQRDKTERQIAFDSRCEVALQAYLDKMTELLLKEKLRKPEVDADVKDIARIRTFTVLRELDSGRKAILLQFLRVSGLIQNEAKDSIINMAGFDLSYAALSWADISGVNLNGALFRRADLRYAILTNSSLKGAHLEDANLEEADLSGSSLDGAVLCKANLSEANLTRVKLCGAYLNEAKLFATKLNYADMRGCSLSFDLRSDSKPEVELNGADLRRADLRGADLRGANLRNAIMGGANLSGANTNLSGADLEGANLSDFLLYVVYQRRVFLFEISNSLRYLYFLDFVNRGRLALVDHYLFRPPHEDEATVGANLRGTNLSGANLSNAWLRRIDLRDANLSNANLSNADLSGANLSGADLTKAIVRAKQLGKARSLKGTTMPDGTKHP